MPADRPQPAAADRPVVLVGLMGAGKTSVATRLAAALDRRFRDSDEDLERRYGGSAAEQYERHGAGVLHEREAAVLREALAQRPPAVIAAAASVVDDPACRAALADAFVVWLDAPPGVLADRLAPALGPAAGPGREGGGDHRPQFHPDLHTMLAGQYERRADRFRQVADLVVDAGDSSPDQTAQTVLAALSAGGPAAAGPPPAATGSPPVAD